MSLLRFFENLLFPPKCVSCGSFLQKNIQDPCYDPFCARCRLEWEREKGETCPDCGLEVLSCRCYPANMKKIGFSDAINLINYRKDRYTVGRSAILRMKKHLNTTGVDFFAEQLSYSVKRYMDEHRLAGDRTAFCHVPRSRKNMAVYGFDQSEELCRRLAFYCGGQSYRILTRAARNDKEQKKLSAVAREKNIAGKFCADQTVLGTFFDKVDCLFIVDDVITTGASLCGGAKSIKPHFDGRLVAVAIARTPRSKRGHYVSLKKWM